MQTRSHYTYLSYKEGINKPQKTSAHLPWLSCEQFTKTLQNSLDCAESMLFLRSEDKNQPHNLTEKRNIN